MIRRLLWLIAATAFALTTYSAKALNAAHYGSSSPLRQGHWVKIGVDTTGVYELSYADLKACGFSDPSAVRVYGYGGLLPNNHRLDGTVPDGLPLTPSVHTADGRLVFYGEGTVRAEFNKKTNERIVVERNPYDTQGHYFLTDSDVDGDIATVPYAGGSEAATWHYCIDLSEREVQQAGEGSGAIFHGPRIKAGGSETASFRVRNFGRDDDKDPRGIFELEAALNWSEKTTLNISLSGAADVTIDQRQSSSVNYPQRMWAAADGGATFGADASYPLVDSRVDVSIDVPANFRGSYAAIDRCYLIYPRLNKIDSDMSELMLNYVDVDRSLDIALSGADSDVKIWDVTDPAAVLCLETMYDSTTKTAKSTLRAGEGTRRLVAFNPSHRHRHPHIEEAIGNQNIHGEENPEILIITTESLLDQALELAEIHREQGQNTLVVTQEATFNEFGSGTRSSAAMRRAVKMFYDRSAGRLRHVILYGTSTGDPRFINRKPDDLLLTYICESFDECRTLFKNYVSDQYFGMLSDSFDPEQIESERMHVSTGRIPAGNANEASTVNGKIRNYFTNSPTPAMALRMLKCSDKLNDAIHLKYANEMAGEMMKGNELLTITHADLALYTKAGDDTAEQPIALLERSLLRGTGLFYYTGHGGPTSLTGTDLYNIGRIKSLNYEQYPLIVLASCLTYPYDRDNNTLATIAMMTPNGGSIGTIAACREVLLEYNRPFSNAIGYAYSSARGGTDMGEILMNARNRMIDQGIMTGDMAFNALCFNYCGDPAVPMSLPHFDIAIDDIEGDKFVSGKSFDINARVVDANGATISDFNGPVHIEVFDGAIDRKSLVPAVKDIVSCDDNLLCEFTATANQGRISTSVYLPTPSQGHRPSRIVVTATDTDSRRYAAGMLRKNGIEESADDQPEHTDPPVIINFGADENDYLDQNTVKPNFTLLATVDPSSSGLAVGVSGIRNRITIIVDGKDSNATAVDGMRFNSDGTVSLSHQIIGATFGSHTYELRVVNNAGLSANAIFEVNVGTATHTGTLTTDIEGTVRESMIFDLDATVAAKRLIVVDHLGNTVLSADSPTFPYRWDLTDLSGEKVCDGHYKAWAMLANDLAHGSTPVNEFTVISGKIGSSSAPAAGNEVKGKTLDLSDSREIKAGEYAGSDIEQLILPASGKIVIGDGAFAGSNIKNLTVNCDVEIGVGAFAACEQLESVVLGGAATVGEYAFRNCLRLKKADVHTARSIPAKVFAGCVSLAEVNVGSTLSEIGVSAFEGCDISDFDMSRTSVRTIGAYAFSANHRLASVELPDNLITVSEGAFFDCMSLRKIKLPETCTDLGNYSLKGLSGVDTVALPEALRYIGRSAMEGMNGLREINASDLTDVPALGEDVWYGLPQEDIKLRVNKETEAQFRAADQWQNFDIYYDLLNSVDKIDAASTLRGRMTDGVISIESTSDAIESVDVYNASGLCIYRATPDDLTCQIDMSASETRIFIVRVQLAGGTCGSLKFVK